MAPSPSRSARPSCSSPPPPPPSCARGRPGFRSPSSTAEKFSAAGRFPGGYFKREGRPSEKEILTIAPLRPALSSALPEGLPQRGAGHRPVALDRHDQRAGHLHGQRRFRRARDVRHPLERPDRLRARRPDRRPVRRQSHHRADVFVEPRPDLRRQRDRDAHDRGQRRPGAGGSLPRRARVRPPGNPADHRDDQAARRRTRQTEAGVQAAHLRPEGLRDRRPRRPRQGHRSRQGEEQGRIARPASPPSRTRSRPRSRPNSAKATGITFHVELAFEELQEDAYRGLILKEGYRSGGRGTNELRELSSHVGVLPRVHGSAIFQRGETQALVTATLGSTAESQDLDGLTGGPKSKSFVLHYNFPPYSVGETGRFGSPGRREIGHGALAERSLLPVVPTEDVFPYTIRLVSDIMASNGSTSMASICGGCLALMDAGVPIIAPVAGISIGLVTERDDSGAISRFDHPHRHPRRGGSFRRHGLQDRRHDRGHHGLPARPQDQRPAVQHRARGGRPLARGAPPDPRQHGRRAARGPQGTQPVRAAHRDRADRSRKRSAPSSARAARTSAASPKPPAPRSTSTRTTPVACTSTRTTSRR